MSKWVPAARPGPLARLLGLAEPAARLEADLQVEAAFGEGVTGSFSD